MSATVVSGIGVAAPTGIGLEAYWAATLAGESGLRHVRRFDGDRYPVKVAGEITGFEAAEHLSGRLVPQTDRMTQLAIMAADRALADAGLEPSDIAGAECGVSVSDAFGGFEFGQRELQNLWREGPQYVSAYMSFAWFYAVNAGQLSIRNDTRGPCGVLVGEQAGGLDAIAHARRNIARGLRLVLAGGMDSSLCPYGWAAQTVNPSVSRAADPERAYLPFTTDACGYVPGEGGAMLVVEDATAVRARGARPYGEIAGYAATFDPRPGSGRPPGLRRAAELAIADAGLEPAGIDAVFADGAGVPAADAAEAEAIVALFGPLGVPVTVPKAGTGRLFGGGGPLDVATALLALRDRILPPTGRIAAPAAGHRLDLVTGMARPWTGSTALVLARGAKGFNAAIVVRALQDTAAVAGGGQKGEGDA